MKISFFLVLVLVCIPVSVSRVEEGTCRLLILYRILVRDRQNAHSHYWYDNISSYEVHVFRFPWSLYKTSYGKVLYLSGPTFMVWEHLYRSICNIIHCCIVKICVVFKNFNGLLGQPEFYLFFVHGHWLKCPG